ncbi:unnamed protein product [Rotaria sordida]|uniref:Uncharacterized protein n=1 Tax=Rotaria sordida TaxID=392033 RepID=A0A818NWJ4_9BILA|nr:unnamed protein product [Rotaria sordida]CAF1003061.1 unnamed protein product [Rotaria sordida]CAF3613591.1 unnamed protein product [Rotaria sordida]CAF3797463.1 unnamed protein product [Rotaria sordida]
MADNKDDENLSSSSDEDDSTTSSSSTSTDDDDDDDDNDDEQIDEESDDNFTTLTPKQAHLSLEIKRKNLGKRLLELRDELKAQPQADIDKKKRLLTEIKNLREKWIAVQTRLTNLKARLSHSPTPEREIIRKTINKKSEEIIQPETRIIPPPRLRISSPSYSSSSRSRSTSTESIRSTEKPYQDLDALDDIDNSKTRDLLSSRPTTSYRDLTDDRSLSSSSSSSPPPSSNQIPLSNLSLNEPKIFDENIEEQEDNTSSKETFYNQIIPYPIVNDKRDLEIINRQLKNQLRELEASKNNPLYDPQSNLINYERLKKQNEYINLRIKIEKLKRTKTKTQREKEQNKKQFHMLLQEFRKLQRFMRSANREYSNNQFLTMNTENFSSSIPLPPSPEVKQQEEIQLPPIDLHKVTGKKILFESSDSDEDEEPTSEPQVPVSLSVSEPRAVPDGFNQMQPPPLPIPSSSSSSATLDAIKTRVANLINAPVSSSSQINESITTTQVVDDDDDDDDDNVQPIINLERNQAISAKFNRKRRKAKRNKHKKKNQNTQPIQQIINDNESTVIDQEEAWKRHVAMQLQFSFLKRSNPILRALTAEAHKKLGVSQDEVNEFQFDDEMMDYETALILQQQQEFLAAAAANPFNVLHNAAVGSSSSRPNLVDILSNLNGGITPSSSEPQTPMGLLQKFFLDANNNPNAEHRKNLNFNDLSTTPPTPPSPRDISLGRKIVESLTHQDINALLKLSGSEHDDDDDDDDDNNNPSIDGDTDDDTNNFSIDEDSNDIPNGNYNNKNYERWERPTPIPPRPTQSSSINNKKSTIETLILPSFNRCTHLGKSTKRSAGVERMFPSFSKHNAGPSSTLSLILYGLSSNP